MADTDATVDAFVRVVLALSPTNPKKLSKELATHRLTPSPRLIDALDNVLDPAQHSLGWLAVLALEANPATRLCSDEEVALRCAHFFTKCDPQHIALASDQFCAVASLYAKAAVNTHALGAVVPLRCAVLKLRQSPQHLTPIHADFFKVCVKARCYHACMPVLDDDIVHLYTSDGKSDDVLPVLTYYYYGGLAYAAMQRFERALQFFSVTVSVPADAISAVMVEAYTKYTLVSLLMHGSVLDLPAYAYYAVRQIKQGTSQYTDLVKAHATNDVAQF